MYFKTFSLGINTERLIEKAGFCVNSYQNVKTYSGINEESYIKIPKDYFYDGSVWGKFEISDFSERLILLCKMPLPPFNELWNIYLNGNKEDSFGALCVIANKYASEILPQIKSTFKITGNSNKALRKKILELKSSRIIANCLQYRQIISEINDFLINY